MAYFGSQHGNVTDIEGWRANPLERGTAEILTTCVITLSLCIWSALHLNIAGNDGWYARIWSKIFWAMLCLLAPEIVAAVAWNQRRRASILAKTMNEKLGVKPKPGRIARFIARLRSLCSICCCHRSTGEKDDAASQMADEEMADLGAGASPPPETSPRKHAWGLKHGFYAQMGGFGLYVPRLPDRIRFLPDDQPEDQFLITPAGIGFLARFPDAHKDIPDLSEEEIDALSRASSFAKFIVCCQALWFCCQCILRLADELPISLLELNTLAHAVCVLLTFIFWWDKPFDVERPYFFETRFLDPAVAAWWLGTKPSSIAELWLEHARSFLADQQLHYDTFSTWSFFATKTPCVNLGDYIRKIRSDIEVLPHEKPEQPDEDEFLRFCDSRRKEADANETPATTSISWDQPLCGSGFKMLPTVPLFVFKSVSPVYYPGYPYRNPLRILLVRFLQRPGETLSDALLWLYSPCALVFLPFIFLVPQFHVDAEMPRQTSLAGNVFDSKHLSRELLQQGPHNIPEFLAEGEVSSQIKTTDANLIETAWQHVQLGSPGLIQRHRLSEWSSGEVSWNIKSDAGLFGSIAFFTVVYGGLHLIALHATFHNDTLRFFWELASIVVMAGIIFAGVVVYSGVWLVGKLTPRVSPKIQPLLTRWRNWLSTSPVMKESMEFLWTVGTLLLFAVVSFVCLVYCAARLFLVIYSFVGLTHQPSEVYLVRPWSAYWPHIS
jgi:hypothetical protein